MNTWSKGNIIYNTISIIDMSLNRVIRDLNIRRSIDINFELGWTIDQITQERIIGKR